MLNVIYTKFIATLKLRNFLLIFCSLLNACSSADSSEISQNRQTIENVTKSANESISKAVQNANTKSAINNDKNSNQNTIKEIKSQYQAKARREKIKFPDDCTDAVPASEKSNYLMIACAEALRSIKPELQEVAKDENCENSFIGLLSPEYAYEYETEFYPFSTNKYLVKMRCLTGAYNEINICLLYDESTIPAKTEILEFPSFKFDYDEDSDVPKIVEKSSVKTIGGRWFDPKTKKLIVFVKARGIGDAGHYARYSFPKGKPKLEEFRAKFKWEGSRYQLDDVIKSPPKTWKRYFPK